VFAREGMFGVLADDEIRNWVLSENLLRSFRRFRTSVAKSSCTLVCAYPKFSKRISVSEVLLVCFGLRGVSYLCER